MPVISASPAGGEEHPGGDHGACSEAGDEPRCQYGHHEHRESERDGQQAGLDRRVVQDSLQVQGQEKEHGKERGVDDRHEEVARAHSLDPKHLQWHERRLGDARLDDQEGGEQGDSRVSGASTPAEPQPRWSVRTTA